MWGELGRDGLDLEHEPAALPRLGDGVLALVALLEEPARLEMWGDIGET